RRLAHPHAEQRHRHRQLRPGVRHRGGHAGRRVHAAVAGPLPEGRVAMTTVELTNVSRWYGNVVAVNDISMTLNPGVTGLLGPNGAGKTTVLHMMAGFLAPSKGTVTIDGKPTWRNPAVYRDLGLVTERESVHGYLTAGQFVTACAKMQKLP